MLLLEDLAVREEDLPEGRAPVVFLVGGLADLDDGVVTFHAGTSRRDDGTLVTAGGRVLTIVAAGRTLAQAREKAYRNVERVRFQGMHYRRDIGVAQPASV